MPQRRHPLEALAAALAGLTVLAVLASLAPDSIPPFLSSLRNDPDQRRRRLSVRRNALLGFADPKTVAPRDSSPVAPASVRQFDGGGDASKPECLRANYHVPRSPHKTGPASYINLSFAKMGTSTLYEYFKCGGVRGTHWTCGDRNVPEERFLKCADCIRESIESGLEPFANCKRAQGHFQLEKASFWPQIEYLEDIVDAYPTATYFLTFRDMARWYDSIAHEPRWSDGPFAADFIIESDITGGPKVKDERLFAEWYCRFVERVRAVMQHYPSATLVEIDIEDPAAGERLEELFGIDRTCWGNNNVNYALHPELEAPGDLERKYEMRKKHAQKQQAEALSPMDGF